MGELRWALRSVPEELVATYGREGWWTDASIGDLVHAASTRAAERTFRVHSAVRPSTDTFGELDRRARSLTASLRRRGVGPGDVVVMQLPNWAEAAVTFWAAAYLGAVIVPVVHFYGAKEVDYILRSVRPDVVVTADRFRSSDHLSMYEALLGSQPQARWLVVGDTAPAGLPTGATPIEVLYDAEPAARPAKVDADAPAVVGFTSGTTSDPKGVVHSHRTIGAEVQQIGGRLAAAGPPAITGSPVGHFTGMIGALLRPLVLAGSVHLVDVWDPATVLRLMLEEGLTMPGGATIFLTSLLDHPDLTDDHLRLLPSCGLGGSAVPVAVTERATKLGITVFRSYGSTEHPSITGCSPADAEAKRLRTDGRPLPGVELRLDDEGQISTRGPELFLGYTDPALTAAMVDADGWYRTGDVGVLDDDGYLAITDRVSDVIIRGGENISAQEIEELVLRMEGVSEVAVVAAPDERLGEHAAAFVLPREGATAPTLDEVRTHLGALGLTRQKWPESLHPVTELPRTASGKVQKFVLRQQLRDGLL
jgi:acyl-CoA synthetase (AMP-forming)/AMP-acid ligase II